MKWIIKALALTNAFVGFIFIFLCLIELIQHNRTFSSQDFVLVLIMIITSVGTSALWDVADFEDDEEENHQ